MFFYILKEKSYRLLMLRNIKHLSYDKTNQQIKNVKPLIQGKVYNDALKQIYDIYLILLLVG